MNYPQRQLTTSSENYIVSSNLPRLIPSRDILSHLGRLSPGDSAKVVCDATFGPDGGIIMLHEEMTIRKARAGAPEVVSSATVITATIAIGLIVGGVAGIVSYFLH